VPDELPDVPEIDIAPLLPAREDAASIAKTAAEIDAACRDHGFFYVVGHEVDPELAVRLDELSRRFFALPETDKAEIAMERAGRRWRGWFPLGGELTSGVPDEKEGLYFGAELGPTDPRVRTGTPLHGANLFPRQLPELREVVLDYMAEMTRVGQAVLSGVARGLGLESDFFAAGLTADPLILFRVFRYPADARAGGWGVGEHTDYGLLTLLAQDANGGLQVRSSKGWIDAGPREGSLVCNLGDMLERLTGGLYRSTPHRVRNRGGGDRLSFPFFIDPCWDSHVDLLPIVDRPDNDEAAGDRWDHLSVHGFTGTYGDYVLSKVGRVFPDLASAAITAQPGA
jgi:isopenicillin N synthase-like dioxygenase